MNALHILSSAWTGNASVAVISAMVIDDCGDNSDGDNIVAEKLDFRVQMDGFVVQVETAHEPCSITAFKCPNGTCINRVWVCNGRTDCGNNTDEKYCDLDPSIQCPTGYIRCPSSNRCIFSHWKCDGIVDCRGRPNDERYCGNNTGKTPFNAAVRAPSNTAEMPTTTSAEIPSTTATETRSTTAKTPSNTAAETPYNTTAEMEIKSWFLRKRNPGSRTEQWGYQVPRIAVALHLMDNSTFGPGNSTGEEIRYELTLQLLHHLVKDKRMSSQELALYIHALLVSCVDPRDFYGDDLVQELRRRVEASENYTNPFLILALCNAGDAMTVRDVERVTAAYDSQHRPFWTGMRHLSLLLTIICNLNLSLIE
ncbi:hypothetical protein AVEN_66993-1 [Araneus ventricosus]|uniref:Low-density lipoprotein receptor-related protein 2 n=1 Tax=Araneus ventricosus TaxID=182803 RepID=A0A4Y2NYR5_ARAVE|nr:hypothetical protein AVEN_66993-1 [Araneus ventricosus]